MLEKKTLFQKFPAVIKRTQETSLTKTSVTPAAKDLSRKPLDFKISSTKNPQIDHYGRRIVKL